jgi:hypothetical protein
MVSVGGFLWLMLFPIIFHLLPPSLFVLKRSELALHWGVGNVEKDKGYLAQKWNGDLCVPVLELGLGLYLASIPFRGLGSETESIYLISRINYLHCPAFAYLGHSKLY